MPAFLANVMWNNVENYISYTQNYQQLVYNFVDIFNKSRFNKKVR